MAQKNIYTCNDFRGAYPVGTAAVVVARDKATARKLLTAELVKRGLLQPSEGGFTLNIVLDDEDAVIILNDGNY
jgi:hypothetical protein